MYRWIAAGLLLVGCHSPAESLADGGDAGPGTDASVDADGFDADRGRKICRVLDDALQAPNLPGGVVAVRLAGGATHVCVGGLANVASQRAMSPGDRFRVGSLTKTFVAAGVLLMAEDGKLSLDDPLSRWVPGFQSDPTIAQALNHSSGLAEYLFDGDLRAKADQPQPEDELLARAKAKPPALPVGTKFSYSNTNYLVAGAVITAASGGRHWSEVVRERLLDRLGLQDTYIEGFESIPEGAVRGYGTEAGALVDNGDTFHPSIGAGAGCFASTASDLARWADALYAGEALTPASQADMSQNYLVPHAYDGGVYEANAIGLGNLIETDDEYGAVYGHSGGTPGFSSNVRHLVNQRTTQVILLNGEATSEQLNELTSAIWAAVLL